MRSIDQVYKGKKVKKHSKDKKLVHGCICLEGNEPTKQIAFGVLKPNTFPIY